MLFIEGEAASALAAVATALLARGPVDAVALVYPGDEIPRFPAPFSPASSPEDFEQVSSWEEGELAAPSARIPASTSLFVALAALPVGAFEATWDFILVRPGELEWMAAAIPHEGMVLVRDDTLLKDLAAAGVQAQSEPPEWW